MGWRITPIANRCQKPASVPLRRARRRGSGTRTGSALMRRPTTPSSAGSSVIAASMASATVIMPPRPTERSMFRGKSSKPNRPIETASPEKKTARPAVDIAIPTASGTVCPRASSSRKRLTMKSE